MISRLCDRLVFAGDGGVSVIGEGDEPDDVFEGWESGCGVSPFYLSVETFPFAIFPWAGVGGVMKGGAFDRDLALKIHAELFSVSRYFAYFSTNQTLR